MVYRVFIGKLRGKHLSSRPITIDLSVNVLNVLFVINKGIKRPGASWDMSQVPAEVFHRKTRGGHAPNKWRSCGGGVGNCE